MNLDQLILNYGVYLGWAVLFAVPVVAYILFRKKSWKIRILAVVLGLGLGYLGAVLLTYLLGFFVVIDP